jgi:hypothetical protein
VPLAIRKPVQREIAALERAVSSGDSRKIQKKQRRLTHAYFCAHGRVKKELASSERERRRDGAQLTRKQEKRQQIEEKPRTESHGSHWRSINK